MKYGKSSTHPRVLSRPWFTSVDVIITVVMQTKIMAWALREDLQRLELKSPNAAVKGTGKMI